jgi:serine beta-lactamase-like protein LACTB
MFRTPSIALGLILVLPGFTAAQTPTDYTPVVKYLTTLVEREVAGKRLPALSIALVDDQRVVWSKGFGFEDAKRTKPATEHTVYRVGSVSKLFTDVAIMRLVEKGKIDLDTPVSKYLPEFAPKNPFDKGEVTLRQLMAHRSGLIRESPVGNYFDPTGPTLEKTVRSVNGLELVYPPGTRIKYSNAAIATVGYVLEKTQGERFETFLKKDVLDTIGMTASAFEVTPEVKKHLAEAVMWTYHGREFPAPTFELGMAPAGSMYAPVGDLAKFMHCLFAGGKAGETQVVKPATLDEMFKPQFAPPDAKSGFGIGFMVGELDGHKRIGHGGAVYGFATELAMLPKEKLGVIVTCSRDVANEVVTRIANEALRAMLATRDGKPFPKIPETTPLSPDEVNDLIGRYRSQDRWLDLYASAGRLIVSPSRGGSLFELRKTTSGLIADDVQMVDLPFIRDGDKLTVGGRTYTKEKPATTPPTEPPAKWNGLIGEYGWDHNTLFIYEKDGRLHALIEWTEIDPLTQVSDDVFAFPPDRGMYHGEKLVFTREPGGRATKVVAANVTFERRKIDGENGETFRIKAQRPIDELRKEAMTTKPPEEKGEFRKPELVDLATIDTGIKFDIRYATDNNFLSTPFYTTAKAYMQKPAAEALGRVHKKLAEQGYGLLVFDAYRPWYVTKMFWDATPEKYRHFVADPSKGSRHNRGCAVDLGLYDLKTGKPVEMVSGFDEFSDRAYPDYQGGTSRQRWHRDLLRRAMESDGFTVYEAEWWHFDYKDWKQYPIGNDPYEKLK